MSIMEKTDLQKFGLLYRKNDDYNVYLHNRKHFILIDFTILEEALCMRMTDQISCAELYTS